MKSKVKRTLNKLKPGKKNKNKNKNKKTVNETEPHDTTTHQADLPKDQHQGDSSKKPVLSDAAHMQKHDPFRSGQDTTQHHEKLDPVKNKHDGIDGAYSQDSQPVLESPSRQHDIPFEGSRDSLASGRKQEILQGAAQLPDPYQKKHAVLAGIHDVPSKRDSSAPLASQGTSSSSMTSSQAPTISSDASISSEAPKASQQDSHMTAEQEKIQRELELELEKERAEKLRLLQEKEVFEHAATNLLQVKGQLVGDMLQLQMDMDKLQMDKMQLEAERVKREQQQIQLQQERAQLQMDKDKLLKEKRILEQPGVVSKLTGAVTDTVQSVFGAPGSEQMTEQAAENEYIDRAVVGLEKPVESKGMISQITDKVKGILPTTTSSGPTMSELNAYEAGLIKGGLRTDDETHLHPEVEQKGMLATLTEKVKGVLPTSMIGTSTDVPEQQGVLSKISQLVFGTDSTVASSSASASSTLASSTTDAHGLDHTMCTKSLESIHPTKIDMDIADNMEAVPLAQQSDIMPQSQQSASKTKSQVRSPKKSPKKVGRRASKKNVYRAKKTDVPQSV
jgi:hypothetical protein